MDPLRPGPSGARVSLEGTHRPGLPARVLIPDLLPQLLVLRGWTRAINTALEDCTFPGGAPAGSRVRMHGTLARARSVPGGGVRISFRVEFEVEGADAPACRALVHYGYFG